LITPPLSNNPLLLVPPSSSINSFFCLRAVIPYHCSESRGMSILYGFRLATPPLWVSRLALSLSHSMYTFPFFQRTSTRVCAASSPPHLRRDRHLGRGFPPQNPLQLSFFFSNCCGQVQGPSVVPPRRRPTSDKRHGSPWMSDSVPDSICRWPLHPCNSG